MTYLTRTNKELYKDRHELALLIQSFNPSVVITVGSGGTRLCTAMDVFSLCDRNIVWDEIVVKHGDYKQWMIKILKHLPLQVKRFIRSLHLLFPLISQKKRYWHKYLSEDTQCVLRKGNDNVVIVDDAIDKGVTIEEIQSYLTDKIHIDRERIKIVTYNDIYGDKCRNSIYNFCTVIFPWSLDFN